MEGIDKLFHVDEARGPVGVAVDWYVLKKYGIPTFVTPTRIRIHSNQFKTSLRMMNY